MILKFVVPHLLMLESILFFHLNDVIVVSIFCNVIEPLLGNGVILGFVGTVRIVIGFGVFDVLVMMGFCYFILVVLIRESEIFLIFIITTKLHSHIL